MRLVCPKCVAQYEVDDQAIPESGREVQCASCEHIWFQDSIQMLPEKAEAVQKPITADTFDEDEGIFDDLDGVGDAVFQSTRDADQAEPASEAVDEDDLGDEDPDEYLPPEDLGFERTPVDEEVLEVLQHEAAFSSARAKLDAAAAQSLDGEADSVSEQTADLAEFISANESQSSTGFDEPETSVDEEDIIPASEEASGAEFDPLGDLDAVRAQLASLEEDEPPVQYEAVLPQDDPVEQDSEDQDLLSPEDQLENVDFEFSEANEDNYEAAPVYDEEPVYDPQDETIPPAYSDEEDDGPPEVDDDFDKEQPRRAYRADGAGQELEPDNSVAEDATDDNVSEEIAAALAEDAADPSERNEPETDVTEPEEEPEITQVALGARRPRAQGSAPRARTIPGAEEFLEQANQKNKETEAKADKPKPESEPDLSASIRRNVASANANGGSSRKELLPDVEELDSTLRGSSEAPVRDLESIGKDESSTSGSFRSSFIRAFFFIALFVALYMMRPMLIEWVPASSVVLDPYASFIDSVRLMIDGLVTKVIG